MKTCDVCKKTDRESECVVSSLFIGTTIDTCRAMENSGFDPFMPRVSYEFAVPCELCTGCIRTVNDAIAELMKTKFGMTIRQ